MKKDTYPSFLVIKVFITILLFQDIMRAIIEFLLAAILVFTYLYESRELFITKLAHRCLLFNFSIMSFHQWARGMGWKGTLLHLAAILLIIISDSSKPNNAAPFLLFYVSISLAAIFTTFNTNTHIRQMWPSFHILGDGEDSAPLIDDILQDVDFISSESEGEDNDEEYLPPGLFLDGPFILGPPHLNGAVTAG